MLDLFCGAGGAAVGLHRAGFDVVGVDIRRQPRFPFKFELADAMSVLCWRWLREDYDFVWASPPCQAFTAYRRRPGHVGEYPNLIDRVRERLEVTGLPYVIENVRGAPLRNPVTLCGSMFGLDVRRHRLFESNLPLEQPACRHHEQTPRFPPATNRTNLRRTVEVGAWRIPLEVQQRAMGIDWMELRELSQAIPPAYSEYLGRQLLAAIGR
jgi:DNA (cytosine-5)-methyltransferase 1